MVYAAREGGVPASFVSRLKPASDKFNRSTFSPMRAMMMKPVLSFRVSVAAILCLGVMLGVSRAGDFDWTYWRGPQMNGHSTLENLPDTWDAEGGEGSNLIWKREDLGTRSTPVCLGNKLYFMARDSAGTSQDREKVVCLDAATGETLWENKFNVYLSDVPAERVAWSNITVDPQTGDVFALGVCGLFQCIAGEQTVRPLGKVNADGKAEMVSFEPGDTIWQHSMHEEYGLLSTYGGRTNHPILHENNVLITAVFIGWGDKAKPQDQYIAFDKRNGQPVWYEGTRPLPYDTTYSGAVLTTFDGEAAMVFGSGDGGFHAFQPRTGKKLWNYQVSSRGVNTTPLVVDGRVYAGHSEENLDDTKMGAFFCLDGNARGDITNSGEIWRVKELFFGKGAPLMIDDLLYVIDDRAKLFVLNPENGEQLSRTALGRAQRSSPLYADGKIYTCTNSGIFYTLKPDGQGGVETLHKARLGSCLGRLHHRGSRDASMFLWRMPSIASGTPTSPHVEMHLRRCWLTKSTAPTIRTWPTCKSSRPSHCCCPVRTSSFRSGSTTPRVNGSAMHSRAR